MGFCVGLCFITRCRTHKSVGVWFKGVLLVRWAWLKVVFLVAFLVAGFRFCFVVWGEFSDDLPE